MKPEIKLGDLITVHIMQFILHVLLIAFSLHVIQVKMDTEKQQEISIISNRIPAICLTP